MTVVGAAPSRERIALLSILGLAVVACALGLAQPQAAELQRSGGEQALDLVRILSTVGLVLALLLGPGIAWRALGARHRPLSLAFLPLPGLLLLAAVAALAWALAGEVEPRVTCSALLLPLLVLLLGVLLLRAGPEDLFEPEEQRCLLVVGCVLGLAVARALWSLGPVGELYGSTISRTLEVGDRSDSRISFIVPQLVAHGASPYGATATALFAPYNFSSRGPLPGLASTPIVLIAGGHPPTVYPEQPWAPFDPEGFMAYRLAMMTFACTAFVSLWDLTRRLAGAGAARVALLLAATTPFLVHEVWFTWPKMLAASFVLLAAIEVIGRRPLRGGLLIGLAYLMHPVALLSLPVLALIALWPLRGARWNRPQLKQLLLLGAGIAAFLVAWRLVNGSHYSQNGFLEYLTQAGGNLHPGPAAWLVFRLKSLGNTLVPLVLVFASASNPSINVIGGTSPTVIHFFFQYWTTFPFGVGILFFPLLLVGLWRTGRRWPWAILATVVAPFALFAVYWGASTTGMLREGLQAWVLTLFVAIGCLQAATRFGWIRSTPIRALLSLRAVELLAVAVVPAIATQHVLLGPDFRLTSAVALIGMLAFSVALGLLVWSLRPETLEAADLPRGESVPPAAR